MSNYCHKPWMCRVDFFKPSGKWYSTEAVDMEQCYALDAVSQVQHCLLAHLRGRNEGLTAVCLAPYNENPHPVMFVVGE